MSTRADIHVALALVDQAFDKGEAAFNLSPMEMSCIRTKRVNELARLVLQFQREETKTVPR